MTDDSLDLVSRMERGDPDAIEILLGRHMSGLRAYVRVQGGRVLRAHEESADIVQSVCREVLTNMDRFQYPSEAGFKHWLYATALRKLRSRYRHYLAAKRDARRLRPVESGTETSPNGLAEVYRTMITPSRVASAREEVALIEEAFDRLPEHYREVLVQARLLGASRAEIAERMGSSEVAVRALLHRATARLASLLDS